MIEVLLNFGLTIVIKAAEIAPAINPKNRQAPIFYIISASPPTMIPPLIVPITMLSIFIFPLPSKKDKQ
jgi:hypothetical protein